jgi:hypothetical protein
MSRMISEEKLVSGKWLFRSCDIADRSPAMGGSRFRIPSGGVAMIKRIISN